MDKDNPFDGDNDPELTKKVKNYAETDPELDKHSELLKCGAQLAQNTRNALGNPLLFQDLTPKQRYYLGDDNKTVVEEAQKDGKVVREGHAGFWGQSKYLKGSILSACLA